MYFVIQLKIFSGFLSGIALKKYSFRQVGLVGAGLFVLGDVMTIFVQRTYQLVFTFGVVRGGSTNVSNTVREIVISRDGFSSCKIIL